MIQTIMPTCKRHELCEAQVDFSVVYKSSIRYAKGSHILKDALVLYDLNSFQLGAPSGMPRRFNMMKINV